MKADRASISHDARGVLAFANTHSRQDHEPAQPDAKAPGRTFSQVDEKSFSFHFAH
jgi:hypothetical protein